MGAAYLSQLIETVERSARRGELLHFSRNVGIFLERGRVPRFDSGVNEKWASAAPMFIFDEGMDSVDIRRRIGASKSHPEEIVEALRDKVAVVHNNNERELGKRIPIGLQ